MMSATVDMRFAKALRDQPSKPDRTRQDRYWSMMIPKRIVAILLVYVSSAVAAAQSVNPPANMQVSIQGSYVGIKPIGQLIRDYESDQGARFLKFLPRDSNQVPEVLTRRECDVGLVLESLASGSKNFHSEFEAFPIGRFVVHVGVNATIPVHAISLDELRDAFRGKTTLWEDVSSAAGRIELYVPLPTSPESSIFQKKVMRGALYARELRDRSVTPRRQKLSSAEVIGAIAKQANAIGFFLHDPGEQLDKRVRVLRIATNKGSEAVLSSVVAIADGSYPLVDTLTLYVHPDAAPVAWDFCEFASGPEGAKIIKQFGLWPEYELEKIRAEQRVAEVKAGKGQPVVVCDLAGVGETINEMALEFARAKMALQVTLDNGGGSAEQAGEGLKNGEADWLVVDGGMEEAWRGPATEAGGQEMVLGSRAVGVVVHPGNSFNELTMDDLRQILAGKVDRWPGATGTAERIVLHALPATNPLMPLVDRAMGADLKRAKATVRPDSDRVILSVASQPGALGLVDLTQVGRHETKVKLLAILPPSTSEAVPPAPDRVPEGYPLARPVHLHLSPKASEAAEAFFAFINEGGGREALLGAGLVPRPLPETNEAEVAAAYGPAEQPETAVPPAQVAAVVENDSPAIAAPGHLHEVLRGALGGPAEDSSARVASVAAQPRANQAAEGAAASIPLDRDRPASRPRPAEAAEARQPARDDGSAPHPAASEPSATEGDFFAWITAHALPIGLGGVGIVAFAIVLGTFGMKRARHRKEVLRRYRP